MLLIAMSIQ